MSAIGLTLAVFAAAQGAAQFDLVCTGRITDALTGSVEAATARYRIDLDAGRWCMDGCESSEAIVDASPTDIVLRREGEIGETRRVSHLSVSRVNGAWIGFYSLRYPAELLLRTEGNCEPAAFTGFPQTRF